MSKFIRVISLTFGLLLITSVGWAQSGGNVSGKVEFFNDLGHFCDSAIRSCTGSSYDKSHHSVFLPIAEVKIYLEFDGVIVGQSTTSPGGSFSINWTNPNVTLPAGVTAYKYAKILMRLEHKDGGFVVKDQDDTFHNVFSWENVAYNNDMTAQTNVGTLRWGNSVVPSARINLYHGAWLTWNYAFKYSHRIRTFLDGLEIKGGGTDGSRYSFSDHTAYIHENHDFEWFVIYHEMGHAASRKVSHGNTFEPGSNSCWPSSTTTGCAHGLTTPEWGALQFEEGLATFLGVSAAFAENATQPVYCIRNPSVACPVGSELSLETNPNCSVSDSDRMEHNITTWLWDMYDPVAGTVDPIDRSYFDIPNSLSQLGAGTSNGQKDEPWNSTYSNIVDPDGRSGRDMRRAMETYLSLNTTDSSNLYSQHCNPVGD